MAIWNLGSINIDHVLNVPHLPAPGETVAATAQGQGLGGKGANHSVACARAGARVSHIGAVGADGGALLDALEAAGVDTGPVLRLTGATGRADIRVDAAGENSIVVWSGANRSIPEAHVRTTLASAAPGDTLLLQNETNARMAAVRAARDTGLRVIYSAAPFEAEAVARLLPFVTILIVNALEAEQLDAMLGRPVAATDVPVLVVTQGAAGAVWRDLAAGTEIATASPQVTAVDTTGAGDTFSGYLAAGLDCGLEPSEAMARAVAAAALSVTRAGAADAIPTRAALDAFLAR